MTGRFNKTMTMVLGRIVISVLMLPVFLRHESSNNSTIFIQAHAAETYESDGVELVGEEGASIEDIDVPAKSTSNPEKYAVTSITQKQVESKLNSLISQYKGTKWTSTFLGAKECKGFAMLIFDKIFDLEGTSIGTGSVSSNATNYKLNNLHSKVSCLGTVYNGKESEYSNLLKKALPGDFLQMRRRSSGGPHSMIVVSVTDTKINIFDCNTDGKCTVKTYSQTFSEFKTKNIGFSLYRSKKYDLKPDKPAVTSIKANSASEITVSWNKISGATSYEIRRKKTGDGEGWSYYKKVGTATGTSYKDTGLEAGTRYAYGIVAVNSAGNSGNPGSDNRKGIYTLTQKPKVQSVTAVSSSQLKVVWTGVKGAASYDVYRRKAGEGEGWSDYKKIVNVTGTEFTDSGLASGTKYHYGIVAINGSGEGSGNPGSENRSNGTTRVPKHTIDLNSSLDGTDYWNIAEYGTVDIYINGAIDADDVSDYCKDWPEGTRYEIRDIRTKAGYKYTGMKGGSLSGTVGTGNVDLRMTYTVAGKEMSAGYDRRLPDGDYMIVSASNPSYYLDIPGTEVPAANGTNVQLTGPNDGNLPVFDVWTITYRDGFYSICQKGSNAALDVKDGSVDYGANVQVWEKNDNSHQKWAINYFEGGKGYRIQSKRSGMSLDIQGGNPSAGKNVQQYIGNNSDAQRWLLIPYEPQKTIADGRYVITSGIDRHIELDIPGDTADVSDGANIRIWNDKCPSQFNSIDVRYAGNGYYNLVHASSGKFLEVNGSSTDNYGNIQISSANGANNQKWCIIPQNGGYMLVNRNSGLVMDVQDGKTEDGTNVRQHYYNGAKAQTWFFEKAEYKVSYDANGGTGAPAAQTKYYANALTLSTSKPTASNKSFKGWAASKTASEAQYQPGASYAEDKDLTLYAVWEDTVVKPQITKHPEAVSTETGTTAKFSVTATGTGLTYQWQYKETGSNTWNKCGLTGAKTTNLQVPVTNARSGYSYRCVVTDTYGNVVNSNGALLTVKEDFAITKQPQNASAAVGKTVQFTVTATGKDLTYQWQYQEAGSSAWNKCGLSGADTNIVSVPVTSARNGYSYHCVVKNASGQSKTSNAAKLTIPTDVDTLSITKHPVSRTSAVGKTVTFSVAATGNGLTYQWQYGPAGSSTWNKCGLEGAKTDTVSVPVVNGRNGTSYRCAVTDSRGTTLYSNAATLTLQADLKITRQPASVTASTGSTVYFSVEATGVGLTYQWQYQEPGKSVWNKCGLDGSKTEEVTVPVTSARNGYGYRCVVTDAGGVTKESDKATLMVNTAKSANTTLIPDVDNSFEKVDEHEDVKNETGSESPESTEAETNSAQKTTGAVTGGESQENNAAADESANASKQHTDTVPSAGEEYDKEVKDVNIAEDAAPTASEENDGAQDMQNSSDAETPGQENQTAAIEPEAEEYNDSDDGGEADLATAPELPSGNDSVKSSEEEKVDEQVEEDEEDQVESDSSVILYEDLSQFADAKRMPLTAVQQGEVLHIGYRTKEDGLKYRWEYMAADEDELEADWEVLNAETDSGPIRVIEGEDSSVLTFELIKPGASFLLRCVTEDASRDIGVSVEVPVVIEDSY